MRDPRSFRGILCGERPMPLGRRAMLRECCVGFGGVALAALLGERRAGADPVRTLAVDPRDPSPLAPRLPHFTPRAKRVIFLFMHGGPSQVDTFDFKPLLQRDHGREFPGEKPRVQFAPTGSLMASPYRFRRYGESGAWVSEIFPAVAGVVDELCFLKGLHGSNPAHGGALLKLHTGTDTFVRPSMGSWVTYGLGSENRNLPGFVTLCPTLGHGGVNNFSSAFLPAAHHGTPLGHAAVPAREAEIAHLHAGLPAAAQRAQLDLLRDLNRLRMDATSTAGDLALEGRIESFELAFRMQMEAPETLDLAGESEATLKLYGLDDPRTENFGRQCLLARRLCEKGVRFVQCTHSYKWDQHGNLEKDHRTNAGEVDVPMAGLIRDLKSRGMLEETLVLWGGEFGRTPCAQDGTGRDHNPHGFTMFMAGGGVKPGFSYGATDDYGWYAADGKMNLHDLHATILALMGLDHERLTFRHDGRDFRLTDVEGEVARAIFA
jgi:hypothetical protein